MNTTCVHTLATVTNWLKEKGTVLVVRTWLFNLSNTSIDMIYVRLFLYTLTHTHTRITIHSSDAYTYVFNDVHFLFVRAKTL